MGLFSLPFFRLCKLHKMQLCCVAYFLCKMLLCKVYKNNIVLQTCLLCILHICILYKNLCTGSRFIVYNNIYTKYTKNSEQVHISLCDLTNTKKPKNWEKLEKPGKSWEYQEAPKLGNGGMSRWVSELEKSLTKKFKLTNL